MAIAYLLHRRAGVFVLALSLSAGCRSPAPRMANVPPPAVAPPNTDFRPASAKAAPDRLPVPNYASQPASSVVNMPANSVRPASFPQSAAGAPAQFVGRASQPDAVGQSPSHPNAQMPLVVEVDDGLFAGQTELTVERVVGQVTARNPSIEAMAAAWQAAAHRYPQVVSLDDPMFMGMLAPASLGSNQVESAYVVGGSQKIPWYGKRAARGRIAQAEANAAFQEVQQTRLQITEAARLAFFDYYLIHSQLQLTAQNRLAVQQFRDTARSRFESNLVGQQDVLQADVAVAEVERRQIELHRMERVAIARLNTLMLRAPDAWLPPPPARLEIGGEPASAELLRNIAMQRRPDLAALAARMKAEQASVTLAAKEFYPDVEVYGRYDSFWQPAATQSQLRPQAGMNMNVPIYQRKRYAALHEAEFRLGQRRAEFQQRLNDIQYEVQSAYEQVVQARQTAELYAQKFLPAAEENVKVARTSYNVGQINFLGLIQAQQQLIMLREKQQETLADYHRRLAELERVVGGELPGEVPRMPEELPRP
jgi:outer membrane protein TolC